MDFESPTALLYHTFNSLFLSLPFQGIEETGTHLALFAQHCEAGFEKGESPEQIIESFWEEYFEKTPAIERISLLFHFIQYVERQVVLFDSVEDALFEQTHEMAGAGSLTHLLARLDDSEKKAQLLEKLQHYNIRMVLTAHPTQFYPGKVLGIINDLGKEIRGNDLHQIRLLLKQLGKTAFVNREKPMPYDEALSLGWYLENVFYHALPDIIFRLLRVVKADVTTFNNPRLLELGFWPGGDRDGNPFVTSNVTLRVARRLRESILRCYHRDVRELRRRLTFRGVEERMSLIEQTINNTLYYPGEEQYHTCTELLEDLFVARQILIDEHDSLFLDELDRFILKVRVFGFYFASLDIRQDSRKHGEVWKHILAHWRSKLPLFDVDAYNKADENTKAHYLLSTNFPLDPADFADDFVRETILSFHALSQVQQENGAAGCHRYIISNCGSLLNVAEVLALARLTSPHPDQSVQMDIVPLFETIDDLAEAGDIMTRLYTNQHYAKHLASRGNVQTIMLGFSDGTKDGGYLRANWSIYRAKEVLSRVGKEHGISIIFFDGRGGPPGRGGGNNASFYAAHGKDIAAHAIQVTIQGQTVSSTYGTREAARYNIERLLSAGLENHLFRDPARDMTDDDRSLLDELADAAYQAYLQLKNHPDFVPYLEKMTPLKWYGDTNIASRPTKRGAAEGLRFEDLRAIPFVGAWAQMKQNVPGYFGFGAALETMRERGKLDAVRQLYQRSLFFKTLMENSMQSLSKSNFDVTRYLSAHENFGDFWKILQAEFERSCATLLEISGQSQLLSNNPHSRESIALREDIVLPLIAIQQFALQKLQLDKLPAGHAEVYRKLVLRAMFGIINAARNAA